MSSSVTSNVAASSLHESLFGSRAGDGSAIATPALIGAMLDSGAGISDLIFSPGRPPQVERHGELVRAGAISTATAYLHATNAGNLRVQLADVPDDDSMIER